MGSRGLQDHTVTALERSGTVVGEIGGKPQIVRLRLLQDCLCVMKEELAYTQPPQDKLHPTSKERTVLVQREHQGGLGLSVKGGKEHHLPILISRIFKDQAADKSGQLFVGDAILKVNGVSVELLSHDEAVQVLKQAGERVSMTVQYFRPASIFLSRHRGSSASVSEGDNPPASPTSMCDEVFQPEPHWTELLRLPLLCGYLVQHPPSSTPQSCESFEVFSMDGQSSGKIQCEEQTAAVDWIHSITHNIQALNAQSILLTNKDLQPEQKVHYMTWVHDCTPSPSNKSPVGCWRRMFLALKGSDVCLFDAPPLKTKDWVRCETITRVYEAALMLEKISQVSFASFFVDKLLKETSPAVASELQHSFLLESGPEHAIHRLAVDTYTELLQLQKAWHTCTYTAITQIQSKSYSCTWQGHQCSLILDLQKGFALYDAQKKGYAWTYRFSQLKGSSDDGCTRLTLQFVQEDKKKVDNLELQCVQLHTVLCAMQAFVYVKLASVDPAFLSTH